MHHAPMAPTATHVLADHLLGDDGPLELFVATRRAEARAWVKIVRDLYEATGGKIDVTFETLRSWFPHLDTREAAGKVLAELRAAAAAS